MKCQFCVRFNDVNYVFSVLNSCNCCRLYFDNEFIIDCFKVHNHKYYFKAFFYKSKNIYAPIYKDTKTELFCAIQNLLKEEMYDVQQLFS